MNDRGNRPPRGSNRRAMAMAIENRMESTGIQWNPMESNGIGERAQEREGENESARCRFRFRFGSNRRALSHFSPLFSSPLFSALAPTASNTNGPIGPITNIGPSKSQLNQVTTESNSPHSPLLLSALSSHPPVCPYHSPFLISVCRVRDKPHE